MFFGVEANWFRHSYRLDIVHSHCELCGEVHKTSQLSLVHAHSTLTPGSNGYRLQVIAAKEMLGQPLPLVKFESHVTQPFCHECADIAQQLDLTADAQSYGSEAEWKEALRLEAERQRQKEIALAAAARKAAADARYAHALDWI